MRDSYLVLEEWRQGTLFTGFSTLEEAVKWARELGWPEYPDIILVKVIESEEGE